MFNTHRRDLHSDNSGLFETLVHVCIMITLKYILCYETPWQVSKAVPLVVFQGRIWGGLGSSCQHFQLLLEVND